MKLNTLNLCALVITSVALGNVLYLLIPEFYVTRVLLMMALGFFWPYSIFEEGDR
jgi:hypothetical protein